MCRTATPSLGFPCAFPWDPSQVAMPEDMEPTDLSDVAFVHQCKLVRLQHQFVDVMYVLLHRQTRPSCSALLTLFRYTAKFRTLPALERERLFLRAFSALSSFRQSVGEPLRESRDRPCSIDHVVFWISYHVTVINLHRPFLDCDAAFAPYCSLASITEVTTSANRVSELLRSLDSMESLKMGPPFLIYHVLRAALVHCMNMTSSDELIRTAGDRNLRTCKAAMHQIGKIWPAPVLVCLDFLEKVHKSWSPTFGRMGIKST